MKNIYQKLFVAICALCVLACSACDDTVSSSLDFSGDVDIHSFAVNGVEGTINEENSSISVILPSGSDLTGLTPQISIADGAEIVPASDESVDFSDRNGNLLTMTYTVNNLNLYQTYHVSVDVARANITSFKIGSVEGVIDQTNKKIVTFLPEGTDVTSLIPIVEYTEEAALTPESGAVVDFTSPVIYTIDYLGSVFTYEVTVILGEAPKPALVIYNGEDVSPIWASIASTINNGYANPQTGGMNTTSTCVAIMRNKEDIDDGGKPWSGGALWGTYKVDIDPAEYNKISLMVLKEAAGDVQIEIQSDGEQNKDWLKVFYSADAIGEWQELIFEIPESRTAVINNILVAPHVNETVDDQAFSSHMIYWDELKAYPKE
ncbi:MAG: hypothetical protein ACERIH_06170 [Labilibaculum antarcticum]